MKRSRFDADEMFGWVEHQAGMGPRRPGSPGGHRNEDFLADSLQDFGLEEVRKEPIPITCWNAGTHSVTIGGRDGPSETIDAFPIAYTRFTDPQGIQAPLVWVDREKLFNTEDMAGKIVVARIGFPTLPISLLDRIALGRHDPDETLLSFDHPATYIRLGWHLYGLAARRGAVGFLGILADQPGGSCRMYGPYGFKEKDIHDKPLPGFWVGRSDGAGLAELARSGGGHARLVLTGEQEAGVTHNVVGEIPGASDEVCVLSCHHDSPFASPVEDASGVAVVLALARHFARVRKLRRRLVVLFSAGHFYGSIGTRTFIRTHRQDIVSRTAFEVSIEHIALEASEGEDGKLVPTGLPEATALFVPFSRPAIEAVQRSLVEHDLRRMFLMPPEGPLGDYPTTDGGDWYAAGVPVVNLISNPVYLLTEDDGLQWVDRERLPRVAAAFSDIILQFDGLSRETLSQRGRPGHRLLMRGLRHLAHARTTCFGRKPVF